ncbi:C-type lectin domain family 4 member F-like isoform X3 [Thunnus thynnus]|uniref:C-type lectin domain family 4 member F-like isoform X3 n=1 Tax=Thunnus thynnus TaxID=8237 RepID=UPI0035271EA4
MMAAAEPGRKLYRVVVVSFGLLCILQAALNISLRLALYHFDNTSCKRLTAERDTLKRNLSDFDNKILDLEASFKTLTEERDELKKKLTDFDHSYSTSYKRLTEERDTLKKNLSDCDNKTLDLEASFKTLTEERDELRKNLTDFDNKILDLEASFKTLTEERDELKKKLTDFDHSYSTSYKHLTEERDTLKKNLSDCDNKTLDLEASFKTLPEERDELRKNLTDFDKKTLDLEASFKTLTEERDELKKKLTDFVHYSQQGWKYVNGSLYYISLNMKTWNESRTDCLQREMDLVVVNSREEQEFINRYRKRMWIGLTDSEREGTWKWVDGTPLTTSFWHSGEPNDHNDNEDCVETKFKDKNSWNDAVCGDRHSWICEKKMFL